MSPLPPRALRSPIIVGQGRSDVNCRYIYPEQHVNYMKLHSPVETTLTTKTRLSNAAISFTNRRILQANLKAIIHYFKEEALGNALASFHTSSGTTSRKQISMALPRNLVDDRSNTNSLTASSCGTCIYKRQLGIPKCTRYYGTERHMQVTPGMNPTKTSSPSFYDSSK